MKTFKNRVSIDERPASVATRRSPGHWEADLMAFSKYSQNILVAHERRSRFILLARQSSKRARGVANRLTQWLAPLPPHLRRSITFDNGTEFAEHWRLTDRIGLKTYFCDPHSPWQKGGVENAIGRMRRPLPRKTDLATLPLKAIRAAVDRYNATPRKCLGWKTPAEAFSAFNPLHFKCESTSRPPPGTRASARFRLSNLAHILQLDRAGHDDVVGGFAPLDLDVAAVIVDEDFAVGEVAAAGGDDGGAVVGAAGEGLAGVAFPGAQAGFGSGENLQEADIDALREEGMPLAE